MLIALICALAAIYQLHARVRLESRDHAVAVIMLEEDVRRLSDADSSDLGHWYQALSEAGLSAVIVPAEEMNDPAISEPIRSAGLEMVQYGGSGAPGLYLAPVEYDIEANDGKAGSAQIAPAETGRIWIMVENNPQTGCVLPDGVSVGSSDGLWAKGFYLRQNVRARAVTTEHDDAQEVGDMLFRAVADRGVQVLWIAPLGDDDGINSDLQTYEALLSRLQHRIERCGCRFGIPKGIEPLELSRPVLIMCGFGVAAAAVLLLCLLFAIKPRYAWILFVLGCIECAAAGLLRPQLQAILLALAASILFPALSITALCKQLTSVLEDGSTAIWTFFRTILLGAVITLLGCVYIGAVLGSWEYILVLQVFRGVKLSQFAVYLFSIVLLAVILLEIRKGKNIKSLVTSVDRKFLVRVIVVLVLFMGVGMVYLLRGGDGMLGVSALENRFRAALENLILYRPRTKEFLIAWPAVSLALCFAARKDRLFTWLFGSLGGIGFASIANTFCHIRAHFLVSLARTALGLVLGIALGTILYLLFRPVKE